MWHKAVNYSYPCWCITYLKIKLDLNSCFLVLYFTEGASRDDPGVEEGAWERSSGLVVRMVFRSLWDQLNFLSYAQTKFIITCRIHLMLLSLNAGERTTISGEGFMISNGERTARSATTANNRVQIPTTTGGVWLAFALSLLLLCIFIKLLFGVILRL